MTGHWKDDITTVTVTHNGGLVIGDFLDALPPEMPLVIVDNASLDDCLDIIRRKRPDTRLVENKTGMGYGNAASQGMQRVTSKYALLANPDSIVTVDAIEKLYRVMETWPECAMAGPTIFNPDGSLELSHDVGLFDRKAWGKRIDETAPDGPVCAEFLSGAVVLVRMSVMQEIDFFDRNLFLYYDDDDMCLRIRQKGHSIILEPGASVMHVGGGSVRPNKAYYQEKFWHFGWSRIYIENKYHGEKAALALAARLKRKFGLKALGYHITGNKEKALRDRAKADGIKAWLRGEKAVPEPVGNPPFREQ